MSLIEIEQAIADSLSLYLAGMLKAEPWYVETWVEYFQRVRQSNLDENEKVRKYLILIDAIKAYDAAQYYNSPLVIIKDTLIASGKEGAGFISGIGAGVKETLSFLTDAKVLIPIVLLAAGVFLYSQLK